ncbi:MAG: hypothetical protein HC934_04460 [Acaryochloridaceae cyanobacterium SU_2_1]|nr:hypothetical protein [Acaryochloridaceae cyanobacterium SU_2_1]
MATAIIEVFSKKISLFIGLFGESNASKTAFGEENGNRPIHLTRTVLFSYVRPVKMEWPDEQNQRGKHQKMRMKNIQVNQSTSLWQIAKKNDAQRNEK